MEITLNWPEPIPAPLCGYVVQYKPFGGGVYQSKFCQNNQPIPVNSEPGPPLTISPLALGSYQGLIYPECCDFQGESIPWCINPYNRFRITDTPVIHNQGGAGDNSNRVFIAYTMQVPVPYPIAVYGTFNYTCNGVPGSIPFETVIPPMQMSSPQWPVYVAGSMTTSGPSQPQMDIPCASALGYTLLTNLTNVQIRRYDTTQFNYPTGWLPKDHGKPFYATSVNTPAPTWNGKPTALPSFSLTNYNMISGGATISWMQTAGATPSCGSYIFEIQDVATGISYGQTQPVPVDTILGWHTYNVQFAPFISDGEALRIMTKFPGNACSAGLSECFFKLP